MGDEQDQKQPTERQKTIEDAKRSVDPNEIAKDLARQQLDFKQRSEKAALENKTKQAKAKVESTIADKKGEILMNVDPSKKAEASAALDQAEKVTLDSTPIVDVGKNTVETPSNTSETSSSQPGQLVEIQTAKPDATTEEAKDPWEKIKEFFSKMFEGTWLGKIFGLDKTTDGSAPIEEVGSKPNDPKATGNEVLPNPNAAPAVASLKTPEKGPNGPDSTNGLEGKALFSNNQFQARTDEIAAKIGCSRSDLYAIFNIESGGKPSIQNPTSGATGLIQWMPKYAPSFGTTVNDLKKMTGLQQLDYVEKFFKPHFGKLHKFSDLYRAVFYPASLGKGADYIFGSENRDPNWRNKVAQQNPTFKGPDGLITNASFEKFCDAHRPADSNFDTAPSPNRLA